MKNKIFMIIMVIVVLSIGGLTVMLLLNKTSKTNDFSIAEYSSYIDEFPSEKVVGFVDNKKIAKEKAELLWLEIYGDSIKDKKPYVVSFDETNQVWLVQGSLPKNYDGGVPNILIQKSDGKVLAIWHDK